MESEEMVSVVLPTCMVELSLLYIPSIKRRIVVEEEEEEEEEEVKREDDLAAAIEMHGREGVPQEMEVDAFTLDAEM